MGDTIETEIVDLLWALRDEPRDVPRLRNRVAKVILQALPELERRGTYWAKLNLVHSCRAFDHNAQASARDASRDTWLVARLCTGTARRGRDSRPHARRGDGALQPSAAAC